VPARPRSCRAGPDRRLRRPVLRIDAFRSRHGRWRPSWALLSGPSFSSLFC